MKNEGSALGVKRYRYVVFALAAVLLLFGVLVYFIPIRTTVQIGADEGFELAKATLCLKGYKLYADVWNDHAPLHTFLVTELLRHVSPSVAGPRLLTVGFAGVLVGAVFLIALRLVATQTGRFGTAEYAKNAEKGTERTAGARFGLLCGVIASVLLVGSPGFLELSSSCMLEIPSLAPGVAAICILLYACRRGGDTAPYLWRVVVAGMLFGISLGMKLIGVVLLPIAALVLWSQTLTAESAESPTRTGHEKTKRGMRRLIGFLLPIEVIRGLLVLGVSCVVTFVGLDLAIDGGAFLRHFHQSWMSHFAPSISSEYGSPNDHTFPFTLLLKNWDLTVPAAVGVAVLIKESRRNLTALVPVIWVAFALGLFGTHKPWWTYYYVHMAVPLSLCAGVGLAWVLAGLANIQKSSSYADGAKGRERAGSTKKLLKQFGTRSEARSTQLKLGVNERWEKKAQWAWVAVGLYSACMLFWIGSRAYVEISGIRKSPQTYYALVLNEIERYKPFTDWIYADELVYSFYSRIPMPPQLAVIPLKRLWSGEMTNAGIREEMGKYRPGLIVLRNDSRDTPFQDLLNAEYRLVYQDGGNRLYAHKSIANKPIMARE